MNTFAGLALLNDILGISEQTLRRRREEFGLETDGFTEISENNLTAVVQSVKSLTPNIARAALEGPRNNEEHRPSRHCTSLESGSL